VEAYGTSTILILIQGWFFCQIHKGYLLKLIAHRVAIQHLVTQFVLPQSVTVKSRLFKIRLVFTNIQYYNEYMDVWVEIVNYEIKAYRNVDEPGHVYRLGLVKVLFTDYEYKTVRFTLAESSSYKLGCKVLIDSTRLEDIFMPNKVKAYCRKNRGVEFDYKGEPYDVYKHRYDYISDENRIRMQVVQEHLDSIRAAIEYKKTERERILKEKWESCEEARAILEEQRKEASKKKGPLLKKKASYAPEMPYEYYEKKYRHHLVESGYTYMLEDVELFKWQELHRPPEEYRGTAIWEEYIEELKKRWKEYRERHREEIYITEKGLEVE
jgi:hypothetical protein